MHEKIRRRRSKELVHPQALYFKGLERHFHLNPRCTGIVASMSELDRYG